MSLQDGMVLEKEMHIQIRPYPVGMIRLDNHKHAQDIFAYAKYIKALAPELRGTPQQQQLEDIWFRIQCDCFEISRLIEEDNR